jgi:hypothetical protein
MFPGKTPGGKGKDRKMIDDCWISDDWWSTSDDWWSTQDQEPGADEEWEESEEK